MDVPVSEKQCPRLFSTFGGVYPVLSDVFFFHIRMHTDSIPNITLQ